MPTSITPLNITEPYQALHILKESHLNTEAASIENYINTKVILNIVQLAVDVLGDTYVFNDDGIATFTTPLIDQAALLDDNETITGAWTFDEAVTFNQPVTSLSTFTSSGQHRCRVYVTTANQTIADSSPTALTYTGESYDVGAMHDTAVNPGRITIPTGGGGLYSIIGQVTFDANAAGFRYIAIFKNGSLVSKVVDVAASAGTESSMQISYHDQANQNDFYELYVYQTSGGPLDVVKNSDKTYFAAMKVW